MRIEILRKVLETPDEYKDKVAEVKAKRQPNKPRGWQVALERKHGLEKSVRRLREASSETEH